MSIQNIVVNASAAQAGQLKALENLLWSASALATQILLQMQSQTDESNFATIESQFGLATGQGTNVYSLLFALANGNPASPSGFGVGAFTQFMGRMN
jgi:hypothetical protein